MQEDAGLGRIFVAVSLCICLVVTFFVAWAVATKRYDAFFARLVPFKASKPGTTLISIYVDQYQGEGKPTLVRLISGQRSLDTRMWQSSVTMKLGDLLTVELFEDSTFGTFGPRFMGRATMGRAEIESSWDPESLKSGKWIKIDKNGQTIGSLKLEVQAVDHMTSTSDEDRRTPEKNPLLRGNTAEDLPDDNAPEPEGSVTSVSTEEEQSESIEPPPDCEQLWEEEEEPMEPPPGFEPWQEEEDVDPMDMDPLSDEEEEDWEGESYCADDAPPGFPSQSWDEAEGPPGFTSTMSGWDDGRTMSGWTDGRGPEEYEHEYEGVSAKTRLTSAIPRIDLSYLAESLEGILLKTGASATRFVKTSRWQQRYFKMFRAADDGQWKFGYWKSKALMTAETEPKCISMDQINDVNLARSNNRDQFVIYYRLEDGTQKQMPLRVVDRTREDWVEKLDMFIREWKTQTANEEQL